MSRFLATLLLLCLPASSIAQSLPALFSVSNVAADDALNIRSEPDRSADIIGSFAPDAHNIEVTARDASGNWGRVNTNEQSGWVSLRYLTAQPPLVSSDFPYPTICFGTEPFWSLELTGMRDAEFRSQDGQEFRFSGLTLRNADGRTDRYAMIFDAPDHAMHGVLERRSCSDGMSDQSYGLDINLFLRAGKDTRLLAGCCSVAPR